ncbi:MAG: reprolysin-like metallopeptidase, partial [Planctomycetota bacterium]
MLLAAEIGVGILSQQPASSDTFGESAVQSGYWADAKPVQGPVRELSPYAVSPEISPLRAQDFRLLRLTQLELGSHLSNAISQSADQTTSLAIPRPDGEQDHFTIWRGSVMSPGLQEKFPDIHVFAGVNKAGDRLFADVSPRGLYAMVVSTSGNYFVDPFQYVDNGLYASYFASGDFLTPDGNTRADDIVRIADDISDDNALATKANHTDQLPTASQITAARSGTQLRTYRTAVAATGEYTAFHGGTVAAGQAAIVAAMNRVSGIYETELSIRMELIPNNGELVYTNATTDPYSNFDAFALLGENQSNIDNEIGNANYDVGHVFGTGGGGLAVLGGVGINPIKAQGQTGDPVPLNDPFLVDFVAHEFGHQFGGDHTFNGDSISCSGLNRNASTAFEPGSGSTIQAYAGICGNDDLQSNSDPFFHSISFDQMIAHVDNVVPAVGTRTPTGNTVPTVDGGLDYVIPARTPFALTATGSDADNDTLTYSWEQRDLGPQRDVNAPDDGLGPIFRALIPTIDPTRTFPRLENLLAGTTIVGEQLPTTTRDLNFRVTARDNRVGGGAINTDDVLLNVVDTGSAFAITSPNAGAVDWPGLSLQNVQWDVAGTTGNSIDAATVNILLSTDGGLTFPITLAQDVANDGDQLVQVPEVLTSQARIRVQPVGNVFFDISDADFTISTAQFPNDFGDAPARYPVLAVDDGASHVIGGPILGGFVDGEEDGQPSPLGASDGSDEDGLTFDDPIIRGQVANFIVTSATGGELDMFLDFDDDGVFGNNANEIVRQTLTTGDNVIPVLIPSTAPLSLVSRLRISTAGGLLPTGTAA